MSNRFRAHLIEPHAGGRISGGYLYNRRLAEHASLLQRHGVSLDALLDDLAQLNLSPGDLVLLDSLFLTPEHGAVFSELRERGLRLGVVLHAFPSFIARAQDREQLARELPLCPTPFELDVISRLDLVLAPGPYVPRLLQQAGLKVRSLICPPGIDVPAPQPVQRSGGAELRLISMGGVTPLKGLSDGVRALRSSKARNWTWSIIGHLGVAPDYVRELRELIEVSGLADRIQLRGQIEHRETLTELQASDILLLPSYTENHPLVALEALAAGVPVVGYAAGGVVDIVRHGISGWLSPVLDEAQLGRHLQRLIAEPVLRESCAQHCRRLAENLPSWAHTAELLSRELERDFGVSQ